MTSNEQKLVQSIKHLFDIMGFNVISDTVCDFSNEGNAIKKVKDIINEIEND